MKIRIFFSFIFFSSYLFPAKIGFINADGANCIYPQRIETVFKDAGHSIEPTTYKYSDKYDLLIAQNKLTYDNKKAAKTILISMEPKIIFRSLYKKKLTDKYKRFFTFDHSLCTEKRYEKMFYPWLVHIDSKIVDRALNDPEFYSKYPCRDIIKISDDFIPFNKRGLSCLLNSIYPNKGAEENYSKRVEVAKFYNKYFPNDLTLYGMHGWKKYNLSIYKGFCKWDDRATLFKTHKFCYCYDNWENNYHYISEKIQTCFNTLCVPIYKGCTRITDYIPKETFINANEFNSVREIHEFIDNMDEETWMGYIDAIRKFVISDESNVFTIKSHAERLLKSAEEILAEKSR